MFNLILIRKVFTIAELQQWLYIIEKKTLTSKVLVILIGLFHVVQIMVSNWHHCILKCIKVPEFIRRINWHFRAFQVVLVVNPPASAGDVRGMGLTPGWGRFPWRRVKGCCWTTKDARILVLWRRIQSEARDKAWSLRAFVY